MLPLRLCLILAILAGIGVIVISQVVLKPHVQGIIDARNDFNQKWTKAEDDKKRLNRELNDTKTTLQSTKKDLEDLRANYTELDKTYQGEKRLSAERLATIEKQKGDLKVMGDELERWRGTGETPERILAMRGQLKDLTDLNAALSAESKLFAEKAKKLQTRLDELLGGRVDPDVPHTVRGKVLVVDPKWDFVVLDVGAKQNLPERGVLLISRNGTLVAKVRVLNVENDRCIANIMPGWKLKDVMEGDLVFPYDPKNL